MFETYTTHPNTPTVESVFLLVHLYLWTYTENENDKQGGPYSGVGDGEYKEKVRTGVRIRWTT